MIQVVIVPVVFVDLLIRALNLKPPLTYLALNIRSPSAQFCADEQGKSYYRQNHYMLLNNNLMLTNSPPIRKQFPRETVSAFNSIGHCQIFCLHLFKEP